MSLLLASAGTSATTFTYEGTGGILFDGTAAISVTYAPSSSGGKVFGGSAPTSFVPAVTSTGGGGWISRTTGRLSWFAEKVQPKPVAKVFTHSPSGGISFGGSAPTSFTSSPRLRREEEEIVMLFALMR